MTNTELLNRILTNSRLSAAGASENLSNVCVFDLDSTLFNVAPRTEQILKEFASTHQLPQLSEIKVHPKDWGLKEILIREGYNLSSDHLISLEMHKKLVEVWSEKFFSNEYLQFDTPYLGAVHFIQTLHDHKIEIHYLTGRDTYRMGQGTRHVLTKWGFPILSDAHLHLKPHRDLDDHKFKLDWVLNFKKNSPNSKIFFFENEPVNINAVGRTEQSIEIVYLNTTHSRKENVNVPVIEIEDFSLDERFIKRKNG